MTAQAPQFYYVPDEICVVVSLDPAGAPPGAAWSDRVYEPVRNHLNEHLARLLADRSEPAGDDPLAADLIPTLARARFDADPAGVELLPLARAGVGPDARDGARSPWVTLARRDGGTTALHFYRIGPGRTTRESWTRDGAQLVRELANLINRRLWRQRLDAVPGAILAATPNWLCPAASNGSGYTGGGPATDPKPAPAPPGVPRPYRFQFGNADLGALVERQRAAPPPEGGWPGVVVAVLDTCPDPATVREKAAATDNWLLQEVAREVSIDDPRFVPPGYFAVVDGIDPGAGGRPADGASHDIPDHGLFAAGIIRDIAPTAAIHLIRVLDDTGVGDLLLLTTVLAALPGLLLAEGQRLVVNLSLMAGLPLNADLPACWFPAAAQRLDAVLRGRSAMDATFAALHASLAAVVAWLAEQGVLVVAAAGNDAGDATTRPEPRYPARYDTVLGVAAVNAEQRPSAFSNQGDYIQIGNGVAVFGGDAGDPVENAVVGIFSQPDFPFASPGVLPNETGWAYWSGTSFATPVMSAIAAAVWAESPHLGPADLIAAVTRPVGAGGTLPGDTPGVVGLFAADPEPDLVCTAIAAWQAPR